MTRSASPRGLRGPAARVRTRGSMAGILPRPERCQGEPGSRFNRPVSDTLGTRWASLKPAPDDPDLPTPLPISRGGLRAAGPRAHRPAGRDSGHDRAQRVRQDHPAEPDGRDPHPGQRRHPDRGNGPRDPRRSRAPRLPHPLDRPGVPGVRAARVPERARQHPACPSGSAPLSTSTPRCGSGRRSWRGEVGIGDKLGASRQPALPGGEAAGGGVPGAPGPAAPDPGRRAHRQPGPHQQGPRPRHPLRLRPLEPGDAGDRHPRPRAPRAIRPGDRLPRFLRPGRRRRPPRAARRS